MTSLKRVCKPRAAGWEGNHVIVQVLPRSINNHLNPLHQSLVPYSSSDAVGFR